MVSDTTSQTPPMCLYYSQNLTLVKTLLEFSKIQLNELDYKKVMTTEWTSLSGCWNRQLKDLVRIESFIADIQSLENMILQILLNLKKIADLDENFREDFMMWALPIQIEEKELEWEKISIILYKFRERSTETLNLNGLNAENVINVPLGSHKITKCQEFIRCLDENNKKVLGRSKNKKIELRMNRFKGMIDLWPKLPEKQSLMTNMLKFNFKAQKWKLRRETLFILQNSKIVKEIFDYNNLLINFSMTSSKNKLINKLFKSIKIKLNNLMMTSSWTTKKNYAALIRDKNIDPEIFLDYNQLNLNMDVWIKNWEVEKIRDFCINKKRKQWELISDGNNDKIYGILEYKQWQGQAKEWCKYYHENKENKMEQDENLNRINA